MAYAYETTIQQTPTSNPIASVATARGRTTPTNKAIRRRFHGKNEFITLETPMAAIDTVPIGTKTAIATHTPNSWKSLAHIMTMNMNMNFQVNTIPAAIKPTGTTVPHNKRLLQGNTIGSVGIVVAPVGSAIVGGEIGHDGLKSGIDI